MKEVRTIKYGEIICKSAAIPDRDPQRDMELINQYTRKELTPEDVYTFPVVLCGNEIDRDCEKFTVESLKTLASLYLGKTGISDHMPSTNNQIMRIYDTQVIQDPTKMTKDGETYHQLVAWAYLLNNESNKNLISEINAGIKKEVSVGCSASVETCSICGINRKKNYCEHRKGKMYDGKLAFYKLENPTDAYEFSFVAIPAQPDAGVRKKYESGEKMYLSEDIQTKTKSIIDSGKDAVISKATDGTFSVSETIPPEKPYLTETELKSFASEFDGIGVCVQNDNSVKNFSEIVSELKEKFKNYESVKTKAEAYEEIRTKAIEEACTNGVKAKGDQFNADRWKKALSGFTLDEITAQSSEWANEAKKSLHAGQRISSKTMDSPIVNPEDYKL